MSITLGGELLPERRLWYNLLESLGVDPYQYKTLMVHTISKDRSLQKVQGHRTAHGRSRRGRDSTHRRPCGTSPQSGDPV